MAPNGYVTSEESYGRRCGLTTQISCLSVYETTRTKKADVILKYTPDEARNLKAYGELPESAKINDVEQFGEDIDDNITFDDFDGEDDEIDDI